MANLRTNNLSGEQGQNAYRGSVFFSGNGSALRAVESDSNLTFGTGDFTIEFWILRNNTDQAVYLDWRNTGGAQGHRVTLYSTTGGSHLYFYSNGTNHISTTDPLNTNSWHHVALTRASSSTKLFVNGVQVGSTYSDSNDYVGPQSSDGIYIGRFSGGSYDTRGYISNLRIVKGTALYTGTFTPPQSELTIVDGTVLLCCQDSDDATKDAVGTTITTEGDLNNTDLTKQQPKVIPSYGVDAGNTFGGPIQQSSQGYMYFPTGRTEERGRGRGVIMGGYLTPTGYLQDIYYVEIQSMGNAFQFGDLTASRYSGGGCGSSTRGLIGGGRKSNGDRINIIESIEFAINSNSIDFGDLVASNSFCPGGGNQTRGIWMGGSNGTDTLDTIQFATIASKGNATDFGNLRAASYAPATGASPTRMLAMGGGNPSSFFAYIDFVEIATTGNAQDFGDMSTNRNQNTGVSSNTRAVAMGGNTPSGLVNSMEFVTIATTGDATDFGDLTSGVEHTGSVNNSIRGVQTGGRYPSYSNIMQFITIASTGNATDFGDISRSNGIGYVAGASDSHGGLS